jgi:hypothetical protein
MVGWVTWRAVFIWPDPLLSMMSLSSECVGLVYPSTRARRILLAASSTRILLATS